MLGYSLPALGLSADLPMRDFAVKEAVLPFARFAGRGATAHEAFYKAQLASGQSLPVAGTVYVSAADADQPALREITQRLTRMGFKLTSAPADGIVMVIACVDGYHAMRRHAVVHGL